MPDEPLASSFRDPSGYVFLRDGVPHRRIQAQWFPHYDLLMESGLYAALVDRGWLLPHEELAEEAEPEARVAMPERLDFVSYPYEWSFSQLKDAALLTLAVQKRALAFGMTLKDATAYNVQFQRGRPVFIDTLSFERYEEGRPWVAYRQFCQHFLAPLALMSFRDVRLGGLLREHLDGIPLDLADGLLPPRCWLRLQLLLHLRVHARSQRRHQAAGRSGPVAVKPLSRRALSNLLESLRSAVRGLCWEPKGTVWADYYEGDSYDPEGSEHKAELVGRYLDELRPETLWDLGANTGAMSRLAAERGCLTLAFDTDPACVDRNYRQVKKDREERLLPLLLDLTNPSPSLGWSHAERHSLLERAPADAVMALALIHHLAIGNNLPLSHIARFLARLAPAAIVEFVPKSDAKVQLLLASREDIFPDYTEEGFRRALASHFEVVQATEIRSSKRTLYLLRRINTTRA